MSFSNEGLCSQERQREENERTAGVVGAWRRSTASTTSNITPPGNKPGLLENPFVRLRSKEDKKRLVTQSTLPFAFSPSILSLKTFNREHQALLCDYVHVCICVCSRTHQYSLMVAKAPSCIVRKEIIPLLLHPLRFSSLRFCMATNKQV